MPLMHSRTGERTLRGKEADMRAVWAVVVSVVAAGVSIGVVVAVPSGDAGLRA
jgi:hypothetical protein